MENKKVKAGYLVSVVIPAYNEEKVILNTLKHVEAYLQSQNYRYEIILADDGSTDTTVSIAKNFLESSNNIEILELPHKGKAPTVIEGLKKAKGDYVLFSDADLATPIEELKKLLYYADSEKYDVVIASREGTGAVRNKEPLIRHIMGRVFNYLIQILLIKGINDTQCGFKLFSKEALHQILPKLKIYDNASEIKVARVSAFDVELLYIAKKLKLKIKSVPVEWTYVDTTRVNPLRDSIVNFMDVLKVWINGKKGKYN